MHRISLIAFFCFVFFGSVEKFFLTCPQVLLFVRNEEQGRPSLSRLVKSASSYSTVSPLCASAAPARWCNQGSNMKEGFFEYFFEFFSLRVLFWVLFGVLFFTFGPVFRTPAWRCNQGVNMKEGTLHRLSEAFSLAGIKDTLAALL